MPVEPHPIDIQVFDTDNSTLVEGARMILRNTTRTTTLSLTQEGNLIETDSDGVAMADLASMNIPDYEDGDKILIIAYKGNKSAAAMYTVTGESKSQILYLANIPYKGLGTPSPITGEVIEAIVIDNENSSTKNCKIYAVSDGELLVQIDTAANLTESVVMGVKHGKNAGDGFVVEREANDVLVFLTIS